jgi:hypothetical protein
LLTLLSLGHEVRDAASIAHWNIDYLKFDNCRDCPPTTSAVVQFAQMATALNATGACGQRNAFFVGQPFLDRKRSVCQDRLGTNVRKRSKRTPALNATGRRIFYSNELIPAEVMSDRQKHTRALPSPFLGSFLLYSLQGKRDGLPRLARNTNVAHGI